MNEPMNAELVALLRMRNRIDGEPLQQLTISRTQADRIADALEASPEPRAAKPVCGKCGKTIRGRNRSLCWSCYYAENGIRSTRNFAAVIEREMEEDPALGDSVEQAMENAEELQAAYMDGVDDGRTLVAEPRAAGLTESERAAVDRLTEYSERPKCSHGKVAAPFIKTLLALIVRLARR